MSSNIGKYKYEPLKEGEIRLLSLLPAEPGKELSCHLRSVQLPPSRRLWRPVQEEIQQLDSQTATHDTPNKLKATPDRDAKDEYSVEKDLPHGDRTTDKEPFIHTPLYEAVSYVWGIQDPPSILHVEGENSGTLTIGPNLHDALKRFCPLPGDKARILWVDQICINQRNLEERTAQVQRMKDIYKQARKVLIWLGEEDEHTELGFGYLQRLYDILGDTEMKLSDDDIFDLYSEFSCQVPHEYRDFHQRESGRLWWSGIPPREELYWVKEALASCLAAAHKISYRSWFERTWTFQEVVLARDAELICGGQKIPWKVLMAHISRDGKQPSLAFDSKRQYQDGLELSEYSELSQIASDMDLVSFDDFEILLDARKQSKCGDPRDKVIALLGLLDDMHDKLNEDSTGTGSARPSDFIKPNYTEPAGNIFGRTARYLIRISNTLHVLLYVDTTLFQKSVPSWVPVWGTETPGPGYLLPFATRHSLYPRSCRGITGIENNVQLKVATVKQHSDTIKRVKWFDEDFDMNFLSAGKRNEYLPLYSAVDADSRQANDDAQ